MTTITLPSDLEGRLDDEALRRGTTPELLALDGLRQLFAPRPAENGIEQNGLPLARSRVSMNLENNPTVNELRQLIGACDDRAGHHILWVAKNGDVHVSRVPKIKTAIGFPEAQPEMQLRYETFQAGNEYVGPEAAIDENWLNQLFASLLKEWPKAKVKPTVIYIDQI